MDPTQLATLAQSAVAVLAPLIAAGALAKIGEHTIDETGRALTRVLDLLRRRFAGRPKAEAALVYFADRDAPAEANDTKNQQRMIDAIVTTFAADPLAIAELQAAVVALQALVPLPASTHTQTINNSQVGVAIAGDNRAPITSTATFGALITTPAAPAAPPPSVGGTPHASVPALRAALPTSLSVDGIHFTAGHALLIGVGSYDDATLSVPMTSADAVQLEAILTDPQRAGYPARQVRRLRDHETTAEQIVAALSTFAAQLPADRSATALVFFAGHGIQRGAEYALLARDHVRATTTGTIGAPAFHAAIGQIRARAKRLVVLLNCCHAGGAAAGTLDAAGTSGPGDSPPHDFYAPLAVGGGQIVIAAARPHQQASARSSADARLTSFGAQLVAGLRGAAPGGGAAIGVFDLFAYLSARVPGDAAGAVGAWLVQEPLLYAAEVDAGFALALRPADSSTLSGGAGSAATVAELAQVEIQLASYADPRQAPAALYDARQRLLQRLGA